MLRSTSYLQDGAPNEMLGRPVGQTSEITREPDGMFACVRSKRSVGGVPGGEALSVTLRSPRVPAGDPLLAERPARVAAEGANPS